MNKEKRRPLAVMPFRTMLYSRNKIQIYRNKMTIDRTVNVHVLYVQMKVEELFTDVQYWGV